jgi:threonyl-tRNA synthetase
VYGVAFPDKAMLKQYLEFQEQAKQRDHRNLGTKQELFFFHQVNANEGLDAVMLLIQRSIFVFVGY